MGKLKEIGVEEQKGSNQTCSDISSDNVAAPKPALGQGRARGPTRRSTKGGWTAEEDRFLIAAVDNYGAKNWKKIAELVPRRADVQCLHRWQKVLDPTLVKGAWRKEEDDLLVELVNKKPRNPKWSKIAEHLPGRIGKQCRERWHNHLNPVIKKSAWTKEEEIILIKAHSVHGNKWVEIAKLLPGRTENMVKNHWNSSVKKRAESNAASDSKFHSQSIRKSESRKLERIKQAFVQEMKTGRGSNSCSLDLTLGIPNRSTTSREQSCPCSLRKDLNETGEAYQSISRRTNSSHRTSFGQRLNLADLQERRNEPEKFFQLLPSSMRTPCNLQDHFQRGGDSPSSSDAPETPPNNHEGECANLRSFEKALRVAASTYKNPPSIFVRSGSPGILKRLGNCPSSSGEIHSPSASKMRRIEASDAKPIERRLECEFDDEVGVK